MSSIEAGLLIALVVVGWPLADQVSSGDLDVTTALFRGAVVAAACAFGVDLVVRLVVRYDAEIEAARQRRLDELFTDMEQAQADGLLDSGDAEDGSETAHGTGPASRPPA